MDGIDEKEQVIQAELVTPSSGIATMKNPHQHLLRQHSDGENVDVDEDEMRTKAFEARESQWNRKLSIKHSEEKRLRQIKTDLSESIVRSFEEARNYYLQNASSMLPAASSTKDHLLMDMVEEKILEKELQIAVSAPGQIVSAQKLSR